MSSSQSWAEVGERVREAREAAGLSQGELAKLLGLDRTALVRVESGQRQLNAMELFRVSDALGVPLVHFVTRPPQAMVSRRRTLAGQHNTADRTRFRLDVELETQARDTQWLVDHGLLNPPTLAEVPSLEPVALAKWARSVIGKPTCGLGPMAAVAERFGLYLTVVDADADGASMLLDGFGVAIVSGVMEPGRRRWTSAHELGHHLLRDEYTAEVGGVAASRDKREQLVDTFAGEFLLPGEELGGLLANCGEEIRPALVAAAAEYRLSWSAVIARAKHHGLISEEAARRLRAETPVRGDFLATVGREPQPDLELRDRGPAWKRAVLRAHADGLITAPRVVELLGSGLTVEDLPHRDVQ